MAHVDEFGDEWEREVSNLDTFFLRYLESARDVIVRESQQHRYSISRDVSTFTDTYVRPGRQVAVRYDKSLDEIEEVRVVVPHNDDSEYPATIAGARDALRAVAP